MKTSIIILTYNKLEYTKQCIDSIRKYTQPESYEMIVVDNNSNDGTVEWLKEQCDIKTIYNKENYGFPKGCNQGIEVACGDNILLLNNDTIVTSNWLENLVTCLYSANEIGAVGPVTNSCSNYQAIKVDYVNVDTMQEFAIKYNISKSQLWEERLKLIGYCLLIRKAVVNEIGLLDERFSPGNFEDDDYSVRIRKAGYKLLLCKDTFIHHYGSTSFKENREKFNKLLTVNKCKFEEKWGFNPNYLSYIRNDIIDLINSPIDSHLNILEIGSNCGATLLKIKETYKNSKLYGIEENKNAADISNSFVEVKHYNTGKQTIDFPKHFFDYIIISEKLEQIMDPVSILKEASEYLNSKGRIICSLHNVSHYSVIKNLLNCEWSYQDRGILNKSNIRYFTLKEMENVFEEAGLSDLKIVHKVFPVADEDQKFIDALCILSNQKNMKQQYETYRYVISATKFISEISIKEVLNNIINNIDIDNMLIELLDIDIEKIIELVDREYDDRIRVLNILAISNFQHGLYDNIIPYLNKAFKIDRSDVDTLYNLAYILNVFGEKELSQKYLQMIDSKDEDVVKLSHNIGISATNLVNREKVLKDLLRRLENGVDFDESLNTLVNMVSSNTVSSDDIISSTDLNIIYKEKVLNIVAIAMFESGIYDIVIPLLSKAYTINSREIDTLYNFGYILYRFGEDDLALKYLYQIDEKDDEINSLIAKIQGEIHG